MSDDLLKPATKAQRAALKRRGFHTTGKGVIVDGPRDGKRNPIKGRRFAIVGDGIVKWTVGGRHDYVVGLTKQDKMAFAKNPQQFVSDCVARCKSRFPSLRNARDLQIRLLWGAYRGTKEFSVSQFTRMYAYMDSALKGADRLTALHFICHG